MTGSACVLAHGGVRTHIRLRGGLVRRRSVNTAGPARKKVHLPLHYPARIMAGKAHLAGRTVTHQEILRDLVFSLYMGIMTTGALDVPVDQRYRPRWVGGFLLRDQRSNSVGSVFHRHH